MKFGVQLPLSLLGDEAGEIPHAYTPALQECESVAMSGTAFNENEKA
jgi:hypothetical protein